MRAGPLKDAARRVFSTLPRTVRERLRPSDGWTHVLHEPAVQLAMQDLVAPGAVAFDVGANSGALATHLSRLVGPTGRVHAFEAHPGIADALRRNMADAAHCTTICAAVVERGGGTVALFIDARANNECASTVMGPVAELSGAGGPQVVHVATLSLDDYCERHETWPDLVKLDIEGAELLALRGFQRTLRDRTPHLILEYWSQAATAAQAPTETTLTFLVDRGYALFDTATYERVDPADYARRALLRNVLAIHEGRRAATPYASVALEPLGTVGLQDELVLGPGRYRATFDVSGLEGSRTLDLSIAIAGHRVHRVRGPASLVALGYEHVAFELERPEPAQFLLEGDVAAPPRPAGGVKLWRVDLARPSGPGRAN